MDNREVEPQSRSTSQGPCLGATEYANKRGPLRVKHGRYINFISDYMADNKSASHRDAVRAWHEVKSMDAPKTYAAWVRERS